MKKDTPYQQDAQKVECANCGALWPDIDVKVCQSCGKSAKKFYKSVQGAMPSPAGGLTWRHVHTYYEKDRIRLLIVLCITLGSPFLGLITAGFPGILIGLVFSVAGFIYGLYAITKVRKEVHGNVQP